MPRGPERGISRKALETDRGAGNPRDLFRVPKGASAERHWRPLKAEEYWWWSSWESRKGHQPKGIGDLLRECKHERWSCGPERGISRKALETGEYGRNGLEPGRRCPERGISRKALETPSLHARSPHHPLGSRKGHQPKGIGDARSLAASISASA